MSVEFSGLIKKDGCEQFGDFGLREVRTLLRGRRVEVVRSSPSFRRCYQESGEVGSVTKVMSCLLLPFTLPFAPLSYVCTQLSETYHDRLRECADVREVLPLPSSSLPNLEPICSAFWRHTRQAQAPKSVLTVDELLEIMRPYKQGIDAKLLQLNKVDFSNANIDDQTLQEIVAFLKQCAPNLSTLDFSRSTLTDAGVALLSPLRRRLKELSVTSCSHLTNKSLEHISKLTYLEVLNLGGCYEFTDDALSNLSPLKNLRQLSLGHCNFSTAGLVHLSLFTELRVLNLEGLKKDPFFSLEKISTLTSLEILSLSYCCWLTDDDAEHLIPLTRLLMLDLSYSKLTDVGVKLLLKLSLLRELDLEYCGEITNEGIQCLSQLQDLSVLALPKCDQVTDQGEAALLEKFPPLKRKRVENP